jgi:hypothetical protein
VKTIYAFALLAPLLGACGDPEPTPEPTGQSEEGSAQVPAEGVDQLEPTDPADLTDQPEPAEPTEPTEPTEPAHPHPEWATIEIDPSLIVSPISPEEYVAKIREALLHHGTKEDPVPVDADLLGAWSFDETVPNPFPPHVRALQGVYVTSRGFMLPDVDFRGITKFHLVRSLWACCFGAPPRLNELLTVTTPDEAGLVYTHNTLEVIGKLDVVFETEDGLINDLYRLHAESIVEGDYDDPMAPEGADPEEYLQGVLPEMEF